MGYRFEQGETVPAAVGRIAHEQVEKALAGLEDPGASRLEEAVHDVRKCCKKLRGLVRLVRPGLDEEYRYANVAFRDAARELSPIRDAHALLATFDDLVSAHAGRQPRGTAAVRRGLEKRSAAASAAVGDGGDRVERAQGLLLGARARIARWQLEDDPELLAGGIEKTYRRARGAFRAAVEEPADDTLHDWRKRVKYGWYHVRLLQAAAPSVLDPLEARLHDLADSLGDDHDLAVLAEQLQAEPDEFGGEESVANALALISERRSDLQERALRLGARLHQEPAPAYAARLSGYLEVWRAHGDELPAGEIAALAGS
jgi:CHAD domain-containing protein